MFRSPITLLASPALDRCYHLLPLPLTSANSVPSVLKSTFNDPTFTTISCLRMLSNARNSFALKPLLHSSLDTLAAEVTLATRHSPLATIPFRIIFFAHPHQLTLIESHLCKKT